MSSNLYDFSTFFEGIMTIIIPMLISMFIALLINVVIGIIAVSMAKKRGLRPVPAFFAGFFGGLIALFFIALTPKLELQS